MIVFPHAGVPDFLSLLSAGNCFLEFLYKCYVHVGSNPRHNPQNGRIMEMSM